MRILSQEELDMALSRARAAAQAVVRNWEANYPNDPILSEELVSMIEQHTFNALQRSARNSYMPK